MEARLAVAQREVARLRQHMRLDGDTIEDLQDQCGTLSVRLNEVAAVAARERQRAEVAESNLRGEVERGAQAGAESAKTVLEVQALSQIADREVQAARAAEARGDALQARGDEVAQENDQLRAQLGAAAAEAAQFRAEADTLRARLSTEQRRRTEAEAVCSHRLRALQHGQHSPA